MIEIAHQRRAGLRAGDVLGRAAHVDVDDVGAGAFRDARAFGHPARFASGQLHDVQPEPLAVEPALRVAPAFGQRRTRDHFGDDRAGAQTSSKPAEG